MVVEAALADATTTTAAGLVPTRFLTEVIAVLDDSRPFIDSIDRDALPADGMDFKIPRRTQAPSVAEQAAEGDEVSSTAFTLDYLTVDVKTFGGGQRISRQLIERSDPAFLDRLIIEMAAQYAQATDAWAFSQAVIGQGDHRRHDRLRLDRARASPTRSTSCGSPRTVCSSRRPPPARSAGTTCSAPSTPRAVRCSPRRTRRTPAVVVSQGTTQGTVAGLRPRRRPEPDEPERPRLPLRLRHVLRGRRRAGAGVRPGRVQPRGRGRRLRLRRAREQVPHGDA